MNILSMSAPLVRMNFPIFLMLYLHICRVLHEPFTNPLKNKTYCERCFLNLYAKQKFAIKDNSQIKKKTPK